MRFAAFVLAVIVLTNAALAQSTAFTYQGELRSESALANGLHDVRFRLFDAMSAGAQVGSTICVDDVPVIEGRFSVTIDFGGAFVSTAARFIEIEVRADTGLDCADTTGYTTLSPRQAITTAPRAAAANTAFSLSAPDGTPANALVVDNDGRVGIGTSTPGHSVTIANSGPTIALQDTDSNGTAGGTQVGYVSYRDAGNVERAWVGFGTAGDPDFSIITARPNCDIVLNNLNGGNVGIGTAAPTAKLEVRGEMRYGTLGQYRPIAGEEPLRLLRGRINADGSIISGSGFTVSRPGTARYLITFNTPFTGIPSVTATTEQGSTQAATVILTDGVSANSVELRLYYNTFTTTPNDEVFSFIVVGSR
ncbi:MAG: hypothetical protein IPK69_00295 [Phycisphaerales bacterium]|nr:MAG: hypothetical protein IPK69_00295 [Phycisphaerales bacterium]